MTKTQQLQEILGVVPDGIWGPKSQGSLERTITPTGVLASSFANPADIRAFRKCKAQGKSDKECFKVGDNGIGAWGDDTTQDIPMCALPPEDWKMLSVPRGTKVLVKANDLEVICELRDTMPKKINITNGAGIDLNPAACSALGLKPPMLAPATWQYV